ncbi:uncharacterized protein [Lepeophtheirus salmonis]|nr:F-box/WD repeat-containing protein 7-like [Lepeophtheirus salmonis]XP_040576259.1 F-box/WD repeat-containing protein 7-like [Lepeophtheirus salmonis]
MRKKSKCDKGRSNGPDLNGEIMSPGEFKIRLDALCSWVEDCNEYQKDAILRTLFPHLGASQLHWLSLQCPDLHAQCPSGCNDFIQKLPIHCAYKILSYLDPSSLTASAQVCKYWRDLSNADWLWHRLCFIQKWRLSSFGSRDQITRLRQRSNTGDMLINWKHVFRERFKLRRSWLSGQCHVRTFEGHTGGISCIQLDRNRIVSGSHDKTIRVWNIKTNSPWSVMTLSGHSGEVRCLYLEGNRLVSGSADSTIKVWDLDIQSEWSSIACKVTMVGHLDKVRAVTMNRNKDLVISGSYDQTVKIWCLKTGSCKRTLRGHEGPVLCVHWAGFTLLSGSADKTIKQWSVETGECIRTLTGHGDAVTCISLETDRIVTGSLDRTIKLWDSKTGKCVSTLDWMSSEGHTGVIRCLQADNWRIVSAADDKTIKVWSLETGRRLVTLKSHTDGVTCLQFNDFCIVSGSYDKTVKLWDFTVC